MDHNAEVKRKAMQRCERGRAAAIVEAQSKLTIETQLTPEARRLMLLHFLMTFGRFDRPFWTDINN